MRNRILLSAISALVVTANVLAAQAAPPRKTAPSDKRIVISKGEVALPRVDTVYVTRFDTVTIYVSRTDTVRVPFEVRKHDTVLVIEPAPVAPLKIKGPFNAGLYAGTTLPSGNIDRLYTTGFHAGALIGYENKSALLGVRLTADVAQLSRESGMSAAVVGSQTPVMFALGGDLKVMPLNFAKWRVYAVGGGNYNAYRGIATVAKSGSGVTGVDGRGGWYMPAKDKWTNKFGFNAGGGVDFNVAGQEMFVEGRAMTFHANAARTWFVPISLGLRYF